MTTETLPAPAPPGVGQAVPGSARPHRRLPAVSLAVLPFYGFAVMVLGMAATAAVAGVNEGLHDTLHGWAVSESLWGRAAQRMADASHRTESTWQLALDFGFSAVNLALAGFLLWLRPRDRTAPLLAFGLIGTAAAFNLQAHLVYEMVDPNPFEAFTHDGFTAGAALAYVFALLLFPDGRAVPRWPWLPLTMLYSAIALLTLAVVLNTDGARTASIVTVFGVLAPFAGVVSQGYRYQRSRDPVERQQSRLLFWALTPALIISLVALATGIQSGSGDEFAGRELLVLPVTLFRVFQPVFLLIPLALLVGIFRFRLWDVDKVISRALLYTVLAGFVSVVYVAVVVGAGSVIGNSETGNIPLSIAATFVVAVTFEPVKNRVQRLVNRLVFGARATPYEALSSFIDRVGDSVATDELLGRMAKVMADGTGAVRADVWTRVGDELQPTAWFTTADVAAPRPRAVAGDELPDFSDVSRAVAVTHHGHLFGALSVITVGDEELSLTEEKLLHDLARQAGLVLRNLQLNSELRLRLDELQASRQRLVSVQDEERRKIERNLHDGAQQQLVALKVHLGLAEDLADELGADAIPLLEMLGQLKVQAGEALEELRDLARGIYPPLLAAEGLPAALASQARKASVPVELRTDGIARYSQDVEAAVYFCVLEAVQNIGKYAGDCHVVITLEDRAGELVFEVVDDGCGFDLSGRPEGSGCRNMADRIEALDGRFEIVSGVGVGTTVRGALPAVHPDGATD